MWFVFVVVVVVFVPGTVLTAPVRLTLEGKGLGEFNVYWNASGDQIINKIAHGSYNDEIEQTGWSTLHVSTSASYPDEIQAWAAGYVEGALTATRISQNYRNFQQIFQKNQTTELLAKVESFLNEQLIWIEGQIVHHKNDRYWQHVSLMIKQVRGLVDGYNSHCGPESKLGFAELFWLNSIADVEDLLTVLDERNTTFIPTRDRGLRSLIKGHCSVLFKVIENDIVFGHTSWFSYSSMLRIFKVMDIPFQSVQGFKLSFSSYPGLITSLDDFILTSNGLAITETTNDNLNPLLWSAVVTSTVPTWIRGMVASRAAVSAKMWLEWFAAYNSGTGNNQWMVLDVNHVKDIHLQSPLPPNTFMILEQIPGFVHELDATDILRNTSFWMSFNRPYFADFFDEMGYQSYEKKFGSIFSYNDNPRAMIFARDAPLVNSLEDVKHILQYNDWQNDPVSKEDAGSAIAARFDLVTSTSEPISWLYRGTHGATDAKVSSLRRLQKGSLGIEGISGPTHQQQPPFSWFDWPNVPHEGHPQVFDFDWQHLE